MIRGTANRAATAAPARNSRRVHRTLFIGLLLSGTVKLNRPMAHQDGFNSLASASPRRAKGDVERLMRVIERNREGLMLHSMCPVRPPRSAPASLTFLNQNGAGINRPIPLMQDNENLVKAGVVGERRVPRQHIDFTVFRDELPVLRVIASQREESRSGEDMVRHMGEVTGAVRFNPTVLVVRIAAAIRA